MQKNQWNSPPFPIFNTRKLQIQFALKNICVMNHKTTIYFIFLPRQNLVLQKNLQEAKQLCFFSMQSNLQKKQSNLKQNIKRKEILKVFKFSHLRLLLFFIQICYHMTLKYSKALQQSFNRRVMLSRVQPLEKSQIYNKKKEKQPDHLLNLLQKNKNKQQTSSHDDIEEQKDKIKKQIMQKRIVIILKNDNRKPKVSQPVPFVKRKWISPLTQLTQKKQVEPFGQIQNTKLVRQNKEQVQKVVRILDINKTLRYFGEYLQVSYDTENVIQVAKLTERQSKLSYIFQKFNEMVKKQRPKLCIVNFKNQKQATFINYLQEDKFYQNVIRKNDDQLTRILIQALEAKGNFTMASYLRFYQIFVWQSADRSEQIEFVLKILMNQCNQRSIVEISRKVDIICKKIFIQNFNKSLQNFNQIMKKLLFGDDYEYSTQKEYHMTRKALTESLQRNEECISIFVNIFYAS